LKTVFCKTDHPKTKSPQQYCCWSSKKTSQRFAWKCYFLPLYTCIFNF